MSMSNPAETAVETEGVNVSAAEQHAINKADEHTPDTDHIAPPVDTATDPSVGTEERFEALEKVVSTIGDSIKALTDTVATLAPGMTSGDEPPVQRIPWTHRGGRRS